VTRSIVAIWRQGAEHARLVSPGVGWFHPALAIGAVVRAGDAIGTLDVLGRHTQLVAPPSTRGVVRVVNAGAVDHDRMLYIVDPDATVAAAGATNDTPAAPDASGPVFRAPTSGRYYGRPSPDKPAFVTVGAELAAGTTVCLLEVMKTFHRVSYAGDRARVRDVLVADGADVNAGDPLLALEAP